MSDVPATHPGVRSLPQFIEMLEDGEFAADGAKALKEINAALKDAANNVGKGSAKLTISVDFKIDRAGVVEIKSKLDTKLPAPPRSRTIAWTTPDDFLTPQNPNQPNLPGVVVAPTRNDEDVRAV